MRFVLGVVVGAVLVALIHYLVAPMPSIDRRGGASIHTDEIVSRGVLESASQTSPADAQAKTRPSHLRSETATTSRDSVEAESTVDSGPSGPRFPVTLPDTHAGFVDKNTPSMPGEHSKLESEDVDPSWSENVEALIYSYVTSHPEGASIQIVSLVCRTTRCEIAGTVYGEAGGKVWTRVLDDMQDQPWFASNFADSKYGSGGGFPDEFRFITMLARTGTEIAPPVNR